MTNPDLIQSSSADRAKPAEPDPPDPDGIVNTIRKEIWRRRYYRVIKGSVDQEHAAAVYGRLGGNQDVQPVEPLATAILPDYPTPEVQQVVAEHLGTLEKKAQQVGETTVLEMQADIAVGSSKVEDLQNDRADLKQQLHELETGSVDPHPAEDVESLQDNLETQAKLAATLAEFRRLYVTAALIVAQITAVLTLESVLVFFSLVPMFVGVVGISREMVIAQSIIIAIALVYLGHGIWAKSTDGRWLSKGCLLALVVTLALVRAAGMMSYGADGVSTDSSSDSITMWALVGMLALASLAFAVLGGHASHRLLEISKDTKTLRKQEGDNLAKWQAKLAAQRSYDAQLRAQRQKQRREIPRVERRIRKIELAIHRHVAKTQKMIQRRIKKNTRTRLSGAVKAMARQLAEWRLRPPQTANGRRNIDITKATMNGILLCVTLLGMGCSTPSSTSSHHILIDNSGSIAPNVVRDTKEYVLQTAQNWVKTAMPAEEFSIWWFSKTGHPFPAEHHSITMPSLSVPAYTARERFIQEALASLDSLFDAVPRKVNQSPLLESICLIALTRDEPWHLTIHSDLRPDSPTWNARIRNTDEELINVMLDLCPPVRMPPYEVLVLAWPGIVARGQDAVQQHRRYRDLFARFFRRWSPEAIVTIRSL